MIRTRAVEIARSGTALLENVPYGATPIWIPDVQLDGKRLKWRLYRSKTRLPDKGLLQAFLRLRRPSATDAEILRFAQDWGVLYFCRHGHPGGHHHMADKGGRVLRRCLPPSFEGEEEVAGWRRLATRLGAILEIAAMLHRNQNGTLEAWATLISNPRPDEREGMRILVWQRHRLATEITRLEAMGNVRLGFVWDGRDARLLHGGLGLFGALVAQLEQAICLGAGLFVCQCCGEADFRRGRKSARRYKYCRRCGLQGAWLINKRNERERGAIVLELHRNGRSKEEMALRLAESKGLTRVEFLEQKDRWIRRVERIVDRGVL